MKDFITSIRDYIGWWLALGCLTFLLHDLIDLASANIKAESANLIEMTAHCERMNKTFKDDEHDGMCI